MQTRLESLIEAMMQCVIGYWISFIANATVLPMMGFKISIAQNLLIGLIFTVISVARGYVIRRWFQGRMAAFNKRLAARIQGYFA